MLHRSWKLEVGLSTSRCVNHRLMTLGFSGVGKRNAYVWSIDSVRRFQAVRFGRRERLCRAFRVHELPDDFDQQVDSQLWLLSTAGQCLP